MKILFPDTNFFIQCQEASQLPWHTLFPDEEHILLIIPKAVIHEIDRHKQDGNTRRARRAKKANSFFREILVAESKKVKIKEAQPIVEAIFSPSDLPLCELPKFLDLKQNDDQIIAEMLCYKKEHPESEPVLLSHDTNLMITAKLCELPFLIIPDKWLLPPEPNTRDKRILELEKMVKELQSQVPQFKLTAIDKAGNLVKKIELDIPYYPELSKEELLNILDDVKEKFPMETNFLTKEPKELKLFLKPHGFLHTWKPPNKTEIKQYKDETYPSWFKAVKTYFQNLTENLARLDRTSYITFCIENFGSAAAESTLIEFHALGDLLLIREPDKEEMEEIVKKTKFPYPPKAPKGSWKAYPIDVLENILRETQNFRIDPTITEQLQMPTLKKRDKNGVFWKPRRPETPTNHWCFECEEYRHQIGKEHFQIGIGLNSFEKNFCEGKVKCVVSAKNLPKPVEEIVSIKINLIRKNSKKEVMKHYREQLELLKSSGKPGGS